MYYLYINAVSSQGYLGIYEASTRKCLYKRSITIAGKESTKLLLAIHDFLEDGNYSFENIEHIICVMGPGSFTGVRTVSLIVNSIAYSHEHIYLTGINFFDLFQSYPIVKSSSKRDVFVKYNKNDIIKVVENSVFEEEHSGAEIYGDVDECRFGQKFALSRDIDYDTHVNNLELTRNKRLAPLYIKKPNIS